MLSFKSLLVPTIISLAATTSAAASCQKNWFEGTYKGDTKCCPGNMLLTDSENAPFQAYCCVYEITSPEQATASSSKSATTTSDDYDSWATAGDGCFTKIPYTASDYSALVSAASSKLEAGATGTKTAPSAAEATATSTSSDSNSSSDAASTAASDTASASGPATSNPAMPVATAEGMIIGGAAVAAALFAL